MTELNHRCTSCDAPLKIEELEQGLQMCWRCMFDWTKKRLEFLMLRVGIKSVRISL